MGVYIEGMEMPKNCCGCVFSLYTPTGKTPFCKRTGKDLTAEVYFNKRSSDCPLVPVPAHGRLIDADALKDVQQADADFFKGSSDYGEKCRYDEAINAVANIVNAPTIIPAEEGET